MTCSVLSSNLHFFAGVVRAAAADLQRVGRSVKAELTRAAWAARWSGLVRLAPKEAAGYVAADGW